MKRSSDWLARAPLGRMAPSTGIATGLVVPLALGAPGNLNPGFADHGRLILDNEYSSQAWWIEALDDGGALVAGGEANMDCTSHYWYYDCELGDNFAIELTAEGTMSDSFTAARPADIEVRDAARQPDGKIVMIGRRLAAAYPDVETLVVYRLEASGALDMSFGTQGIFELPSDVHGTRNLAHSVVLDPDGAIVVSGAKDEHLIVMRLLADGLLDASFGEGGVFTGPLHDHEARTFIERTATGYRLSTMDELRCQVVGLTASGIVDDSFGIAGVAPIQTSEGEATTCSSFALQPDGSMLLSGTASSQPFITRMLTSGASDPSFSAGAVADTMTETTAIAVDASGRILIAGAGESGAMVMRLDAGGALDVSFGEGGVTVIDLPTDSGSQTRINALDVDPNGRVLAAGGAYGYVVPFVVQLLGEGDGDSPGVLSVVQPTVESAEGEELIVKVRRTGGSSGTVSVAYATVSNNGQFSYPARPGQDFLEVAGTLTWTDGETGEREIAVSIQPDAGIVEEYEGFMVALSQPQGDAGLGTRNAYIFVPADGAPAGQFAIDTQAAQVNEADVMEVWVSRNYYFDGAVSVTLTPVAGTASADDFDPAPVTLNWADQEGGSKVAQIRLVDDDDQEAPERFTAELSNPTGGAVVGQRARAEIEIIANDQNDQDRSGGGGGSTGLLSLLLLALAELFRRSHAPREAPP